MRQLESGEAPWQRATRLADAAARRVGPAAPGSQRALQVQPAARALASPEARPRIRTGGSGRRENGGGMTCPRSEIRDIFSGGIRRGALGGLVIRTSTLFDEFWGASEPHRNVTYDRQ